MAFSSSSQLPLPCSGQIGDPGRIGYRLRAWSSGASRGARAPASLKVFLLAVAIIDDLGAIVIIAIFYTAELSLAALACAPGGLIALFVLNRAGVMRIAAYVLVGIFL